MTRIMHEDIQKALQTLQGMDDEAQDRLEERMLLNQLDLVAATLLPKRYGASSADMETLLKLLVVVYTAMELSGLPWPKVSSEVLEKGFNRLTATVNFADGLSPESVSQLQLQWMCCHDEKFLLLFALTALVKAGYSGDPLGKHHYYMCGLNLAESLAIVGKSLPPIH